MTYSRTRDIHHYRLAHTASQFSNRRHDSDIATHVSRTRTSCETHIQGGGWVGEHTSAVLALAPNLTLRPASRQSPLSERARTPVLSTSSDRLALTMRYGTRLHSPPLSLPRPDSLSMTLDRGVTRVVRVTDSLRYVLRLASGHSHGTMKRCM